GLPELRLPLEHPRRKEQRYQGARQPVSIPATVARALAAVGRREGATPYMVLLAGYQALLHRYTAQEDFGIGTAIAGRGRAELEPLVGCFVNTLVLRADLSGNPSFLELLRRVRVDALGAFAHQELPFERLVDALGVARDLSVPPVIQTLLVLHNTPVPRVSLGELSLSGVDVDPGASKLDLTLELRQVEDGGLEGSLEYDTDLFEPDTVARMSAHLVRLLERVAEAPERRVGELALLSDDERRELLLDWSGEQSEPPEACFHQLFEAWAARSPDAVALRHVARSVTYGELNARANRLAARLLSEGLEPEGPVAVFTRDPAERIAAFLGALKAGGAYLPLDPALPKERMGWMLADARVAMVLADDPLAEALPSASRRVLRLRDDAAERRFSSANPELQIHPEQLAYVLFTSGSTGRPKGVLVPHRGIANLVAREAETWELRPGATLLQLSAPGFDVSVGEISLALASGATLLLPPADAIRAGPDLLRLLEEGAVTTASMVPTALATLAPAAL
ncbi:MAG TPA: AMP-binding protein, partial [Longimicrobium sp.]|nr:AMP-binding protein [Longimicrobium sp.]